MLVRIQSVPSTFWGYRMARDSLEHFDHDTDARNHPKFKALRATYGWEGVGRFWALNEMIGGATYARLDLSKKVYRATAAEDLGLTLQAFDAFLAFLSDPEECGILSYQDGIVTTGRTTENWEALKAYRDKEKARKTNSTGKPQISTGKASNSSGTPAETNEKPAENGPSSVKSSSVKSREEFAGSVETPDRETIPFQVDFEPTTEDILEALEVSATPVSPTSIPTSKPPIQSHGMTIPPGHCERFTNGDLDEVVQRFGSRSQEALDTMALYLAAGDYRHKRPWFAVKTWLAKEVSAVAWLDKATGKGGASPRAEPMSERQLEASRVIRAPSETELERLKAEQAEEAARFLEAGA